MVEARCILHFSTVKKVTARMGKKRGGELEEKERKENEECTFQSKIFSLVSSLEGWVRVNLNTMAGDQEGTNLRILNLVMGQTQLVILFLHN